MLRHFLFAIPVITGCGFQQVPLGIPIPGTHISIPSFGDLNTVFPLENDSIDFSNIDSGDMENIVFLSPRARSACYYMKQQDLADAIGLFSEIAAISSRDLWMEFNGYPCDASPDTRIPVPRADCVQCAEAIFDVVGR